MPTERDPKAIAWLGARVLHADPLVRLDVVSLLGCLSFPQRREWLDLLCADEEPAVARAAREASILAAERWFDPELFESDFAAGRDRGDPDWRWHYIIRVYVPGHPGRSVRVHTQDEDDVIAKRIARIRCGGDQHAEREATMAFVTERSYVCRAWGSFGASRHPHKRPFRGDEVGGAPD